MSAVVAAETGNQFVSMRGPPFLDVAPGAMNNGGRRSLEGLRSMAASSVIGHVCGGTCSRGASCLRSWGRGSGEWTEL